MHGLHKVLMLTVLLTYLLLGIQTGVAQSQVMVTAIEDTCYQPSSSHSSVSDSYALMADAPELNPDSAYLSCVYVVQVGAYHQYGYAQEAVGRLAHRCHFPIHVNKLPVDGLHLYKILVGDFAARAQARDICQQLRALGMDAFVTCAPLQRKM